MGLKHEDENSISLYCFALEIYYTCRIIFCPGDILIYENVQNIIMGLVTDSLSPLMRYYAQVSFKKLEKSVGDVG